jgi:hypothetical protein
MNAIYFWLGLGLLLMGLETVVPGAFMLWFGFAALAMGGIVWLLPELHGVAQAFLFGGLALVSVQIYRAYFRAREPISDQPLLNRRAQQHVGRVFVLTTPIENGFGKVKIGDALWTVAGDAMPEGARVEVVDVDGLTLRVKPAT